MSIYPSLNDPFFQKKISLKKEFQYKYDGKIGPIEKKSEDMCKKNDLFELKNHQEFVRNYLSYDTPYNSLLLYHGLGSGKTCSASSITESLRHYSKLNHQKKKILIVASPNVQENFKLQLFDPSKLIKVNGVWDLQGCIGNELLNEINLYQIDKLNKEDVSLLLKKIIQNNYSFMGYVSFANFIRRELELKKIERLKYYFNSKVIVIDEIHNIRLQDNTSESIGKKVAQMLDKLVRKVKGIKFVFLTATPMFNNPTEIIFILNLMLRNDKRKEVKQNEIFDKNGNFQKEGKKLLQTYINGYVSYVRGENPYNFPYLIQPSDYKSIHSSLLSYSPLLQFNKKEIKDNLKYLDLFEVPLSINQEEAYLSQIKKMNKTLKEKNIDFDQMDSLGYNELMKPIQYMLISYPKDNEYLTSEEGIYYVINKSSKKKEYTYKDTPLKGMFEYENIGKYSSKIKSLIDNIIVSEGVIIVYSQFIFGGIIPVCLALEEYGFQRYGTMASNLFEKKGKVNVHNLKKEKDYEGPFKQAMYTIISGDKTLTPNSNEDIKALTNVKNKDGETIKVILITQAGSEGIDLKFLRQVHIMEPWYNMNRIHQIIGRAIRNCSHKDLELTKRNVCLYLYSSLLENRNIETLDRMLYRISEKKSIKIGMVTRTLKETSIDCILNKEQQNFSKIKEIIDIVLSNGNKLKFNPKDKPFTSICDYLDNCDYTCVNKVGEDNVINKSTYKYIHTQNHKLETKIIELFKKKSVYKFESIKKELETNTIHEEDILSQLNYMIDNDIVISNDSHTKGTIVSIGNLYLFQPYPLKNKKILIHNRYTPIYHKPIHFSIKNNGIIETTKKKSYILEDLLEKYRICNINNNSKDENWDNEFYEVKQYLKTEYNIREDKIDYYLIDHLCDTYLLEEQIILLNEITKIKEKTKIEEKIYNYFKKFFIIKNDTIGIGLIDKEKTKTIIELFVYNKEENKWNKSTPSEKTYFEPLYEEYKKKKLSRDVKDIVGFMGHFNNKNFSFKTKDKKIKLFTGLYVLNNKKTNILDLINNLLETKKYTINNTKNKSRTFCTILAEFLMRHFNDTRDKIYFLSKLEYFLKIENN